MVVLEGWVKHRRDDLSVSNQQGGLDLLIPLLSSTVAYYFKFVHFFVIFYLSRELPAGCHLFFRGFAWALPRFIHMQSLLCIDRALHALGAVRSGFLSEVLDCLDGLLWVFILDSRQFEVEFAGMKPAQDLRPVAPAINMGHVCK